MDNILEVAAFSVEWAVAAAKSGADRIELCSNISEGGTTPSYGTINQTLKALDIPVFPLIRPRGGNFVYSKTEFNSMIDDILMVKETGAQGIVLGILTEKGEIDIDRNSKLIELAKPLEVSFHRAFDITPDPLKSLQDLISIGFDRVLTSGQETKAQNGIHLLGKLSKLSKGKIKIIAGAGIDQFNVHLIAKNCDIHEFHLSARRVNWEEALDYKGDVHFCAPGTRLFKIDVQKVIETRERLNHLKSYSV